MALRCSLVGSAMPLGVGSEVSSLAFVSVPVGQDMVLSYCFLCAYLCAAMIPAMMTME